MKESTQKREPNLYEKRGGESKKISIALALTRNGKMRVQRNDLLALTGDGRKY